MKSETHHGDRAAYAKLAVGAVSSACGHPQAPGADPDKAIGDAIGEARPDHEHALVDLNGDARKDAIVFLTDTGWCGSGSCTMLVPARDDDGYAFVSRSTVTNEPIRVSDVRSHGWRDIIVPSDGARLMAFDGSEYPLNPSTQSAPSDEQMAASKTVLQ